MADARRVIEIVFGAVDQTSAVVGGIGNSLDQFNGKLQNAIDPLANATSAVLFFTPSLIVGSLYIAPTFSMIQGLARLNMRAMASAILFFVLNLVGLGLGPYLIGLLSDVLKAAYGDNSLRYAMLGVLPANVLATIFYLQAARTLKTDLAKSKT